MKRISNNLKKCNANWDYLVTHFTSHYIENMTDKKEYVIGFGNKNKSFCYLVEVGTKELGGIRGSNSSKFGLWYGTHGKDRHREYRATKERFNCDVDTAFNELKIEIARIIRISIELKEFHDIKSFISPMFKHKIMYLYNKGIMLPIFFIDDLKHFEKCLGLEVSISFEQAQIQLMKYRDEHKQELDNYAFMCYLYKNYGRFDADIDEREDYKLNKSLRNYKATSTEYTTHPVEKVSLKKTRDGVLYYPRNPKMAEYALSNANYKCEYNDSHECFIKRSNNLPYTEVHHLIPLAYHYRFDKSLDIPENIISLCSNCHNEIHYGKNADKMIEYFYNKRKQSLHEAHIDTSLNELLKMYHDI